MDNYEITCRKLGQTIKGTRIGAARWLNDARCMVQALAARGGLGIVWEVWDAKTGEHLLAYERDPASLNMVKCMADKV